MCRTAAGVEGDGGVVAGPRRGSRWNGPCADQAEAVSYLALTPTGPRRGPPCDAHLAADGHSVRLVTGDQKAAGAGGVMERRRRAN